MTEHDKLREAIKARIKICTVTGCWVWQRSTQKGYGALQWDGRLQRAHRLAYQAWRGPTGTSDVLHDCDRPACCNPFHLTLGTHADNMRDMARKGRGGARDGRGERNGNNTLTLEKAKAILQDKRSSRVLAPIYGVHPTTIQQLRAGKTWPEAHQ